MTDGYPARGSNWRQHVGPFLSQIKTQAAQHAILYKFLIIYAAAYLVLVAVYGLKLHYETGLFFLQYCLFILFIFGSLAIMLKLFRLMLSEKSDQPTYQLLAWSRSQLLMDARFGNGVHAVIIFAITIFIFSSIKVAIPAITPFVWDEAFMKMDLALFLGVHPWQMLQKVFGYPYATIALSILYNLWIIIIAIVIAFSMFSKNSALRIQFFLSCALTWAISGGLLAIVFSSAGPCYYGYLVAGFDPYQAQMAYLREVEAQTGLVYSLNIQDLLWLAYTENDGKIAGISAMPSLHIIFSLIIGFYVLRIRPWIGCLLLVYAATIFVGSVHLAWHYAVDGVAAFGLALLAWLASGWIAQAGDLR